MLPRNNLEANIRRASAAGNVRVLDTAAHNWDNGNYPSWKDMGPLGVGAAGGFESTSQEWEDVNSAREFASDEGTHFRKYSA
jgi:hypothetical protein